MWEGADQGRRGQGAAAASLPGVMKWLAAFGALLLAATAFVGATVTERIARARIGYLAKAVAR